MGACNGSRWPPLRLLVGLAGCVVAALTEVTSMVDLKQWGRWEAYAIVGLFVVMWLGDILF